MAMDLIEMRPRLEKWKEVLAVKGLVYNSGNLDSITYSGAGILC